MIPLQAPVVLKTAPTIGATYVYDYRIEGPGMKLSLVLTERIAAVRPDGTIEATRTYSKVKFKDDAEHPPMAGVESISGKTDRYLVGPDGEWKPRTANTELGFFDFPYEVGPVAAGSAWTSNGNLRYATVRLESVREIAGRRAAVLRFTPREGFPQEDRLTPDSVFALSLADGRPLYARIGLYDATRKETGAFILVRRGVDVKGLKL